MSPSSPTQRPLGDVRGAVFVEKLIALLPLLLAFFATWEVAELTAAKLVVQRACAAAGRAAIVVLPDDPVYYDGEAPHVYDGRRREDIELAAAMVLSAIPRLTADFEVEVSDPPKADVGSIEVTVSADYDCGVASLLCGSGGAITLTATTAHTYQLAKYVYTSPGDALGGATSALTSTDSGAASDRAGYRAGGTNSGGGRGGGGGGPGASPPCDCPPAGSNMCHRDWREECRGVVTGSGHTPNPRGKKTYGKNGKNPEGFTKGEQKYVDQIEANVPDLGPVRVNNSGGMTFVEIGGVQIVVPSNDPKFVEKTLHDIAKIAGTPAGRQLLRSLEASGKRVTVGRRNSSIPSKIPGKKPKPLPGGATSPTGYGSTVDYTPGVVTPETGATSDIILFHELVHADSHVHGFYDDENVNVPLPNPDGSCTPPSGKSMNLSEARAVGLGPFGGVDFNENNYRHQRGKSKRTSYGDPGQYGPDEFACADMTIPGTSETYRDRMNRLATTLGSRPHPSSKRGCP